MNANVIRRSALALTAALLLGVGVIGAAAAQDATPTPTPAPGAYCPMHLYGPGPGAGPGAGWGYGPMAGFAGAQHEAIARALGMTVDELYAARQEGKTVAQLAAERGVDLETVVAAALEVHKQALDALVAAGRLTQAQADLMLAHAEANIRAHFAGTYGPAYGPGMMGRGFGPGYGPMHRGFGPGTGFGPRWQNQ